ncbi:MAG: tRNA (adenosine(37)-N6)-dimethylallyltransferase MiaA [Bacteroidetes bacterium HGW-Bacteroidetes-9]|jgi:tRNA dimethylallyltransferase|nr:MAG: tRNA (adenosine(37)-N6)-dimethylallyltransferase MiaA [Bacteroidetes bacterium HGW-Bacteroidetes-9]
MVDQVSFPQNSTLLLIAGPTAVGKTSVAIDVARHFGCEIISADSRQFYSELKIGTATPTAEQQNYVKHHFVGNLSLTDNYNVSRFENEVLALLSELFAKNKFVVMVGGSGLYIKAVCDGIDDLPDVDDELRNSLHQQLEKEGIASIRAQLQKLDPAYYSKVDLANPNRIIRALEVCLATGKPYSAMRKQSRAQRNFRIIKIGLNLPRKELHERINQRVEAMMKEGLLDEARSFYPQRELNALNTVGYKELFDHFDGKYSLEDAIEKIKTNTRRYARRQITWFKKEADIFWCQPDAAEVIGQIESRLT